MKKENHTNNHSHNTNQTNKIKTTKANVVARPSRLPSRPARIALHCLAFLALPCLALRGVQREGAFIFLSFLFCSVLQRGNPQHPFPGRPSSPPATPWRPLPLNSLPPKRPRRFPPPFWIFFFPPLLGLFIQPRGRRQLEGASRRRGAAREQSRAEPSRAEPS